jgi:branched-chain amino acid transport system substrate-binding protein
MAANTKGEETMARHGAALSGAVAAVLLGTAAAAADTVGVTATEVKIGQTAPYSGALSAWSTVARVEAAYVKMANEQGGVNGRKIDLVSLDDGYSPPKALEATRRLVEQEQVAFIFTPLGVPSSMTTRRYLNDKHVPQLFVLAPVQAFNDPQHYPWSIGFLPTLYLNGRMAARYILAHKPEARIGVLYQHDEVGREHLAGLRDGLGGKAAQMIVKEASYEVTDPTVDSQVVALQAAGADTFYNTGSVKFAAQAIRKAYDIGWRPLQIMSYTSASINAVLKPAGLEKSVGIVAATYGKDPTDPHWQDAPDVKEYLAWVKANLPSSDDPADPFVAAGYSYGALLIAFLKQCGDDLSRENVMREAANLHGMTIPLLLPGVTLNTSPEDFQPIKDLVPQRFNGERWELLE